MHTQPTTNGVQKSSPMGISSGIVQARRSPRFSTTLEAVLAAFNSEEYQTAGGFRVHALLVEGAELAIYTTPINVRSVLPGAVRFFYSKPDGSWEESEVERG